MESVVLRLICKALDYRRIFGCFLILTICGFFSYGQEDTLTYQGDYRLGDYLGDVRYEYLIQDGDTLKEGEFRFRESEKNPSDSIFKFVLQLDGHYQRNTPSGLWKITKNRYTATSSKKLVNHKYVTDLDGVQWRISVQLDDGKADGSWKVVKDSIQDSNVLQNLFKSEMTFQQGIPVRSFSIISGAWSMAGRLLRNGLAHDEWTLFSSEGIEEQESWYFENGLLRKIQVTGADGMSSTLRFYNLEYDKTKTLPLDHHFIDILELLQSDRDSSQVYNLGIAELLNKNLAYFRDTNKNLSSLAGQPVLEYMKVKVPFFPIPEISQAQLDTITNLYQRATKIDQALLDDTQLNLLRLNDTQTDLLYRAAEQIKDDYLRPLGKLVNYHHEELLQHVDTLRVLDNLWPDGFPPAKIKVDNSDDVELFFESHDTPYDPQKPLNINSVLDLAYFTLDRLELLKEELNLKLSATKKAARVLEQENKLIEASRQLRVTLVSLPDDLPEDIETAIAGISRYADERLEDYSSLPASADQVAYAGKLISCFERLAELSKVVSNLPQNMDELAEVYTDEVWNPFTATLMDEKVKKRLTRAYGEKVVPFILKKVESEVDCSNASAYIALIEQLNERMFVLREKDTKRLERRIKRKDDITEILSLLGINATPWNGTN